MVINLWLKMNSGKKLINLEYMTAMNYEGLSCQLHVSILGEPADFVVQMKDGTPAEEVWRRINKGLSTLYDPRSMQHLGYEICLDFSDLQDGEVHF